MNLLKARTTPQKVVLKPQAAKWMAPIQAVLLLAPLALTAENGHAQRGRRNHPRDGRPQGPVAQEQPSRPPEPNNASPKDNYPPDQSSRNLDARKLAYFPSSENSWYLAKIRRDDIFIDKFKDTKQTNEWPVYADRFRPAVGGDVSAMAFSPDGKQLTLIGSKGAFVKLTKDSKNPREPGDQVESFLWQKTPPAEDAAYTVAYLDNNTLLIGRNQELLLRHCNIPLTKISTTRLAAFSTDISAIACYTSLQSKTTTVAVGLSNGSIWVFTVPTTQNSDTSYQWKRPVRLRSNDNQTVSVSSLAFADDGKTVCGLLDGTIVVWNLKNGSSNPGRELDGTFNALLLGTSVSANSSEVVALDGINQPQVVPISSNAELETPEAPMQGVNYHSISHNSFSKCQAENPTLGVMEGKIEGRLAVGNSGAIEGKIELSRKPAKQPVTNVQSPSNGSSPKTPAPSNGPSATKIGQVPGGAGSVGITADGNRVFFGDKDKSFYYYTNINPSKEWRREKKFTGNAKVTAVLVLDEENQVIYGDKNGELRKIALNDPKSVPTLLKYNNTTKKMIVSIRALPNSIEADGTETSRLVTASLGGQIIFWTSKSNGPWIPTPPQQYGGAFGINWMNASPDGRYIVAVGTDNNAKVWGLSDGYWDCSENSGSDNKFSATWITKTTLLRNPILFKSADFQTPLPPKIGQAPKPVRGALFAVAFCGSRYLALGTLKGWVGLYDLEATTHNPKFKEFNPQPQKSGTLIYELSASTDGRFLVGATDAGKVRVWDIKNLKELKARTGTAPTQDGKPSDDRVYGVSITSDGKEAVSISRDGYVAIHHL